MPGSPIGLADLVAPGNPQAAPNMPMGLRGRDIGPPEDGKTARVFDAGDYTLLNGEQVYVLGLSATATLILSRPNTLRNFLLMRNAATTANIYVSFGTPASANSILKIIPGNHVLFDTRIPQDDVFAFSDAADGTIIVAYSATPGRPTF